MGRLQLWNCLILSSAIGVVHGVEITPRTYQLIFDAIVSPAVVAHHASNPQNSNPVEPYHQLVPPTIATEVAATIGSDFLALWLRHYQKKDENANHGQVGAALGLNCFPGEGNAEHAASSTTCFVDHTERDVSFQLSVRIYSPYNTGEETMSDISAEQNALSEACVENGDPVPVAARVDATLQGPGAKHALVKAVPKLIKLLQSPSNPPPVWAIQERQSSYGTAYRFHSASISSMQTDRRREQLSIDRMVLSNPNLIGRIPVLLEEDNGIELWQYTEMGEQEATRSLFIKSSLRATTSSQITRTLLNPRFFDKEVRLRLVDQPNVKVALVSEVPLTMIAMILEQNSVTKLDIIGADEYLQDLITKFIPKLNQCDTSHEFDGDCMGDERLHIIDTGVNEWAQNEGIGEQGTALYDVIFVDEESYGISELQLESKLIDGGLVVGNIRSSSRAA